MNEPIRLLDSIGLDEKLLHQLQLWMNERYEHEIKSCPRCYLGKRVQFIAEASLAYAYKLYAGRTCKVTDAYFCLDSQDELFRYDVTMDNGEKVCGVTPREWAFSSFSEKVEVQAKHGPAVTIKATDKSTLDAVVAEWNASMESLDNDPPFSKRRRVPSKTAPQGKYGPRITATNMAGKTILDADILDWKPQPISYRLGRSVRIIDCSRSPHLDIFLKEGVVTDVFDGGTVLKYHVKVPGIGLLELTEKEVCFL